MIINDYLIIPFGVPVVPEVNITCIKLSKRLSSLIMVDSWSRLLFNTRDLDERRELKDPSVSFSELSPEIMMLWLIDDDLGLLLLLDVEW